MSIFGMIFGALFLAPLLGYWLGIPGVAIGALLGGYIGSRAKNPPGIK